MPNFIMMCGMPGSGKDTWIAKFIEENKDQKWKVVSTDDYIMEFANSVFATYNNVFASQYTIAEQRALTTAIEFATNNENFIWNQTNLTIKARIRKLKLIPKHYHIKCVYLTLPSADEYLKRLDRPGKIIPMETILHMHKSIEIPSHEEGWDQIGII